MDKKPTSSSERRRRIAESFSNKIEKRGSVKLRAQRQKDHTVWFGLGMFGTVGWSVAIPTLIGVAIGVWIDRVWPSRFSWTLMLLIGGVMLGCLNAWYWVRKAGINSAENGEDSP
ncbi:MAG: AtpZ/AtpI family protein [Deltaproteobacteria bacterium]|nr:AtpZ/AtpI family protein [Deltaproteobacteria bacterium]